MTRLLRVELSRLLARRMVLVLAVMLFGGMLLLNGIRFARASDADVRCASPSGVATVAPPGSAGTDVAPPQRLEAQPGGFVCHDRRVRMVDARNEVIAAGIVVVLVGFLVGTSFGGAEWAAGTMQALLFWEPRRGRVMAAKAGALAIVLFFASLAAQLVQLGLSALAARFRGTFAGLPPDFYQEIVTRGLRLGVLAIFASLVSFGIAGLTRNTAASLGIGFVYFAVFEGLVRGLRPRLAPYLVSSQFEAWIDGEARFFFEPRFRNGAFVSDEFVLRSGRAGITLAVYLAVVFGAATVLFMRRDVT